MAYSLFPLFDLSILHRLSSVYYTIYAYIWRPRFYIQYACIYINIHVYMYVCMYRRLEASVLSILVSQISLSLSLTFSLSLSLSLHVTQFLKFAFLLKQPLDSLHFTATPAFHDLPVRPLCKKECPISQKIINKKIKKSLFIFSRKVSPFPSDSPSCFA